MRTLSIVALVLLVGCGKAPPLSDQPAPNPVDAAAERPAGARPSEPAAPPAATDETRMAALLGELTRAVRKYGVEKRRVPKTLEELVANGYLNQVPQPPAGKKFAINKNLQVYLADE
jgi:hypothetical protein